MGLPFCMSTHHVEDDSLDRFCLAQTHGQLENSKVTVAQMIDVKAAAENGGFASIGVPGAAGDEEGGEGGNQVSAAVPVSMIQQLAGPGGAGVVLMMSTSKESAAQETNVPGSGASPADDAAPPTEPTLQIDLAAPPLSLSVAVNGKVVKVTNLAEPILLTLLSKRQEGFECSFYNETSLEWSSEGIEEHEAGDGGLVCASTHLTVFAAIKKTWIGLNLAITCLPAEVVTAEGLSSIVRSGGWRVVGAAALCVFTLTQGWVCFVYKAYRQRYHPAADSREAVSFSHHFMSSRSASGGGALAQLQVLYSYVSEDLPRTALSPGKTLRLQLAQDAVLQRVARDLGPTAEELQIMLQWGQAERSRRRSCKRCCCACCPASFDLSAAMSLLCTTYWNLGSHRIKRIDIHDLLGLG